MIKLAFLIIFLKVNVCDAYPLYYANSHRCVGAAQDVASRGDGSHENSCMSCDPTYPSCSPGCQKKIDNFYAACDSICLPDGYFFDPKHNFYGCWDEVLFDMKIQVERCGCNSASRNMITLSAVVIIASFLSYLLL